jgi:WD40 repeat protein
VAKRKLAHTLKGAHTVAVFSPREPLLITAGGPVGTVSQGGSPALRFWDGRTGKEIVKNDAPSAAVMMTHWLGDGKLLAVSPAEDCYRLWDVRSSKQLARVATGVKYIWWSVVSADGKFLAVSEWRGQEGDDMAIHLFDVPAGKEIHRMVSKPGSIPIGFTSDGRTFVSALGNVFAIWDTATGKLVRRVDLTKELAPGHAWRSALSGDGKSLVVEVAEVLPVKPDPNDEDPGSKVPPAGHYRCVIDLEGGKKRWRTDLDASGITVDALVFSPDGKIVVEGLGATIRLRDSSTGALVRDLACPQQWHRWLRQPGALAFTPDSKTLIANADPTTMFVWDVATGKELHRFSGHRGRIFSISTSPDNTLFATASEDSTVLLWPLAGR